MCQSPISKDNEVGLLVSFMNELGKCKGNFYNLGLVNIALNYSREKSLPNSIPIVLGKANNEPHLRSVLHQYKESADPPGGFAMKLKTRLIKFPRLFSNSLLSFACKSAHVNSVSDT